MPDARTERCFELGAMSRAELEEVLESADYPPDSYAQDSADIRALILAAEFPEED